MKRFDANSWEEYDSYSAKIYAETVHRKNKALKAKKDKEYNSTLKGIARHYTKEMKGSPSALEKKMQEFLDVHNVIYEFQKPLYIHKKGALIKRFYIVDFYIPSKNLIIETDGKFHDNQVQQDIYRTREIQKYYPNMKVLRWRWHDFESFSKMKYLLQMVS